MKAFQVRGIKDICLAAVVISLCGVTAPNETTAQALGHQKVSGTETPGVVIDRDRYGVPHIRAGSEAGALFGLGYAHAKDRLWQMEYQRRLASGRLAEILGEKALGADRLFRTLGLQRTARALWANYGAHDRELIEAYVAGVNAYLSDRYGRHILPQEFQILGIEPAPWRPEDVLVWAKVLAWTLGDNWDQEILRSQLNAKLGPEKASQLMPVYTGSGPVIVSETDPALTVTARRKNLGRRPGVNVPVLAQEPMQNLLALNRSIVNRFGLGGQDLGSNSWVLSGRRTSSGKPILASDPHLDSQSPGHFYLAHVSGGDLNAIGGTLPGLPLILIGHNNRIAWAETNANADVQDLYVEHINGLNQAEYEGRWEPLQVIPETIKVKGQADVLQTVRVSRHGPLVSDLVAPSGPALALWWTMLDANQDGGVRAYLRVQRSLNWKSFKQAFVQYGSHPQNETYADVDGNIGYLLPGPIPVRSKGDGTAPVPGWNSEYQWTGYIPSDELPSSFNPEKQYIVSANNLITGSEYPYRIGNGYAAPFRAARIAEMIESKEKLTRGDVEEMQSDVLAVHARELLPTLLRVKPADARGQAAIEMLSRWDYNVSADSAAAAIFEAWYIKLAEHFFADDLGEPLWKSYSDQSYMVAMAVANALRTNQVWCDDINTVRSETCADTILAALNDGLSQMARFQDTKNISAWRWDKAHRALFPHSVFDPDPVLGPLFSRNITSSGDKYTVNVSSNPEWDKYDGTHLPAYRQSVDFGDLDHSQYVTAPGQTGNPLDVHYDDLLNLWQSGRNVPMFFSPQALENESTDRIVLAN